MMNSSFDEADADDFLGQNPFRSSAAPQQQPQQPFGMQPQQQQQQNPYGQQPQQQQPYMQQPQQQNQFPNHGMNHGGMQQMGGMNQQPPMMQQQPPMMTNSFAPQQQQNLTPDPNSGFVGQLQMPPPPQQQQPPPQQQPYNLSGTMDTNNKNGGGGQGNNNYGSTADAGPGRSYSIFSWRGLAACCRLETYAAYFDVDTLDIYLRLKAALLQFYLPDHFRTAVLGEADAAAANNNNDGVVNNGGDNRANAAAAPTPRKHGPDLYGPFWMMMTVIFCVGVTSNLSAYMHSHKAFSHTATPTGNETSTTTTTPDQEFEYDMQKLLGAFSVISTFAVVVPAAFWLGAQCMGMPGISLVLWLCMYGYSLTPVLVASWVAWIPVEILEWTVLAVACTMSVLLVVRNLSTPLLQQDSATGAKAAPLIMAILAVHFVFCVVLKFMFYP